MNILYYLHQFPAIGGIETVTATLANWFAGKGYGVTIVSHVSKDNADKTVALVESEKSAVIASIVLPQYLWVSCGGKMNLEAGQKHLALKGRKVVMFPDTDTTGETFAF